MYCYYQGEMEVTEGTGFCLLRDVVETVGDIFEKHAYVYRDFDDPAIIIVDFSDSCYVSEGEIRVFVEKAKSFGWKVNAKIPYHGDYEGWMVITDNEIEEYSTDEMAVKEYLESDEAKKIMDYDNRYDVLYCKMDDTSNSYGDEIDSNIILLKDMDTEEITGITIMDFKRSYNVNNLIRDTLNKFFNAEEILAMVN